MADKIAEECLVSKQKAGLGRGGLLHLMYITAQPAKRAPPQPPPAFWTGGEGRGGESNEMPV